nr:hypothetical protein [uncultured Albidiferax sp.]
MFKPPLAHWLVFMCALPVVAAAQTTDPTPATPNTQAEPAKYRSALDGYQPYTDEKTANWKEANDTAGRIGGWRVYAKEARQPQAPDPVETPAKNAPQAKP